MSHRATRSGAIAGVSGAVSSNRTPMRPGVALLRLLSLPSDTGGRNGTGAPRQTSLAGVVLCFFTSPHKRVRPQKASHDPGEPGSSPSPGVPTPARAEPPMGSTEHALSTVPPEKTNAAYSRWAAIFERAHHDTNSTSIALEVLDTLRERERGRVRAATDEPGRILRIAAALFHVPAERLRQRNRRSDVTSARYVSAWILRRRHWSLVKLGEFFHLDHTTILSGLRKVDTTPHLLYAAYKAEQLLEIDPEAGTV